MREYRLYTMSGLAEVGHVEPLFAEDDAEAVRLACAKNLPVDCEVWDRNRLVAEIPTMRFENDFKSAIA